jgi:hypothetical protein
MTQCHFLRFAHPATVKGVLESTSKLLSVAPKRGGCGGMKPEPAVSRALHLPAHQDLHGSAVQRLPGRLPYPCPRLPEVGRSLLDTVARELDQLANVSGPPSVLSLGQCSIHIRGVGSSLAWITPAAIASAELMMDAPGLLRSSEQITTGASRMSSGR